MAGVDLDVNKNLDKKRIDLIKGMSFLIFQLNYQTNLKFIVKACYIKKLRSVNKFVELWPSIVISLRQKCHDIRKGKRGYN